MGVELPVAKAVEKSAPFTDAKFYTIEGKDGYYRRLTKPSDGSVVALFDEKTLKTQHFLKVWESK